MAALFPLFSNNILPILLAAGTGYLLGRITRIDARTISRVTFFVFSPCLVFQLLTANRLGGQAVFQMATLAVLVLVLVGLLSLLVGRLLKLPRPLLVAFVLASMFGNAGNYGLSFNAFAFGEEGLAFASVYFVTSGLMVYTVGILVASLGQGDLKYSLANLVRYPTLYAVIFALVFNGLGLALPVPAARTVDLLAGAAIPSMLLLLGLQLGSVSWRGQLVPLGMANAMRLVAGPLVAFALAGFLNLEGAAYQAGVAESAMPTAVMATVLATEFDAEPAFATAVVTTTTLLSPFTLTPLLAYLMN
ncbi:MAG: AEC family transporter [Chloroflexi bacterium]|nr:AEC family transporter [Chloroflexota bacterium]